MEQREKLIELIIESVHGVARNWAEVIADHLIANGVVVLSCKVGTVVYEPIIYCDKGGAPLSKCYVGNSCDSCGYYISKVIAYPMTLSDAERLGKNTVFLTYEEAEKALAKRKGGDYCDEE